MMTVIGAEHGSFGFDRAGTVRFMIVLSMLAIGGMLYYFTAPAPVVSMDEARQAIVENCHVPAAAAVVCDFVEPDGEPKVRAMSTTLFATLVSGLRGQGVMGRERFEPGTGIGHCLPTAEAVYCLYDESLREADKAIAIEAVARGTE